MKLISWNVNGIRAAYRKGLSDFIESESPDLLCLQETKAWPEQLSEAELTPLGYKSVFSNASKKGYSGVAMFYKDNLSVQAHGINKEEFDHEGRFLISDFADYRIYNIYFPSGTSGEIRQNYKYEFLDAFYAHISRVKHKKIIVCGDFNICHRPIDIHHPDKASKLELSGFLPDERAWMDKFVSAGFVDTFRHTNGDAPDKYSWWSYRAGARQKNLGWRIDYFFVQDTIKGKIKRADILTNISGSDHAPILLEI